MKRPKENPETLDAHLGAFRSPPRQEIAEARERTLQRLRLEPVGVESVVERPEPARVGWRFRAFMVAAAAAIAVVVYTQLPAIDARGVVESADGSLQRVSAGKPEVLQAGERIEVGEIVRTDGEKGGSLRLRDGSRVEMRAHSELALERAEDGVRIRLKEGGLIVNAAKQRTGHLYVQTKDVTVSVIGTVFLVNAEEQGSRVAVIEGEVHVQHGASERKLRRGEQVATGLWMEPQPVKEEIAWSQNAVAHVALLQQAVNAASPEKSGSVTGTVRTAEGNPAAGVRVTAMRSDAADDTLRAMASLTQTDEAGRYRLENVPPGSYYIAAGRVDLPTFYPGTQEIAKGTAISIASSTAVTDIDFVIRDTSAALPARQDRLSNIQAAISNLAGDLAKKLSDIRATRSRLSAAWWIDPEITRRIGLSEDQKKKIEALDAQHQSTSVQNQTRAEREADDSRMEAAIREVLSESQKAQLHTELERRGADKANNNPGDRLNRSRVPPPPDGK